MDNFPHPPSHTLPYKEIDITYPLQRVLTFCALLLFVVGVCARPIVAVIGTGVDGTHQDLVGRVIDEACFGLTDIFGNQSLCPNGQQSQFGPGAGVPCPLAVDPFCAHETWVAGVVVQNGDVDLMPIQVYSQLPGGAVGVFEISILQALVHVRDRKQAGLDVQAVNISIADLLFQDPCPGAGNPPGFMQSIISDLATLGVPTFIGAGNDAATDAIAFPACTPASISVSGHDQDGSFRASTNTAYFLDLLGLAQNVTVPDVGGGYRTVSGSSFGPPVAAGVFPFMGAPTVETARQAFTVSGTPTLTPAGSIPAIDTVKALQVFGPPDTDSDAWSDVYDNCSLAANADQRDTNQDGYGNLCDPDLDNNGLFNGTDYSILDYFVNNPGAQDYLGVPRDDADLDGDSLVNAADRKIALTFLGLPPGPSGLAP